MPWAPSYATVDDLRDFVRVDDAADDAVIETALAGASRAIDYACDARPDHSRQFGQTDALEARYFTAEPRGYGSALRGQWVAVCDDIATPVGLLVLVGFAPAVEVTGTTLLPRNADKHHRPYTAIGFAGSSLPCPSDLADDVRIEAVWGWPSVPEAIHLACLLQASRLVSRRDAPFGVAGSPEVGSEVRLLAKLDPDVETLVRPFVRKIGTVLA